MPSDNCNAATQVLFGILPAVMAWKQRYQRNTMNVLSGKDPLAVASVPHMVPGGRVVLVGVIVVASAMVTSKVLDITGALSFW